MPLWLEKRVIHSICINSESEPTTSYVDEIRVSIEKFKEEELCFIGIGGGTVLDITKALSILLKTGQMSEEVQGWNLVSKKSFMKVGVPTIAGTGAEVSQTAVLTSLKKKQGINDPESRFDLVIYDESYLETVPLNQEFYTAMDGYIHSLEAIHGSFCTEKGRALANESLEIFRDYFFTTENKRIKNKLFHASKLGGESVGESEVGICHALSYGLSFEYKIPHGLSNCLVIRFLKDYYKEGVVEFLKMEKLNNVQYPKKYFTVIKELTTDDIEKMIPQCLLMDKPLRNALGEEKDFASILRKHFESMKLEIHDYEELFSHE